MNYLDKLLEAVTPEVYEQFKLAIETRKWPSGQRLTDDQLATCLQAVIAYEHKHLPPEVRTGYVEPKDSACEHDDPADGDVPIKWQ